MLQLSSIIRRVGFMMLLTLQLSAFSQSNYSFTPSTAPYTPITGTAINVSPISIPISIGFNFNFNGVDYSQVIASKYGWLSFNTSINATMAQSWNEGDLANTPLRPLIGVLYHDNGISWKSQATQRYSTTGTAPNRVFTFEWYYSTFHWYTNNDVCFQIKLYETSNKIEMYYLTVEEYFTQYDAQASIGLAFSNIGDYLAVSSFNANATASTEFESHYFPGMPNDNQKYTFTPITTKAEPTGQCSNLTAQNAAENIMLTWNDAVGAVIPDGYVIMASETNSFTTPTDGTFLAQDNDLSDGSGIVKVLAGKQFFSGWKNAKASTTYYFKVFAYTNGGNRVNYNTINASTAQISLVKSAPKNHVTNLTASIVKNKFLLKWNDVKRFGNALVGAYCMEYESCRSYADCGNNALFNITGNQITLEAWVNPARYNGGIFQKENLALDGGYRMYINSQGQLCFGLYIGGSWSEVKTASGILPINSWSHICGTYNGTTQSIYISGVLVASKSTTGNITSSSVNLYIGRDHSANYESYEGLIDEMAIWSTARTQAQIASDMNLNLTGSETGLSAYYKCENNVNDATPNAINATIINNDYGTRYQTSNADSEIDGYVIQASNTNSFPALVNGTDVANDLDLADNVGIVKVAQGVQKDSSWINASATQTYYFRIVPFVNKGSNIVYNTTETIPMVSIKPAPTNHVTNFTASGVNGNIIQNWTDATGAQIPEGYVIIASTSPSILAPVNGTEVSIDNNLADGAGTVKVLPGVQSYSGWINLATNTTYYFNIYPYTNNGGTTNYKTNGTVPQANGRIVIYSEPTNHVTGFSATNPGVITLNWTDALGIPSLMANVLNFDGANDYVTCTGSQNASVFTAEAWYSTSSNTDQAIVSTLSEVAGTGFEIHTFQGKPVVTLRNTGTWLDLASPTTLAANTWNHIALVYDGALIKLYVNGQLVNSTSLPSASYIKGTSPLVIGKRSSGLLNFNGSIEEVRMWNIARTQTEIQNNMYNELAGTENGLISYYKFNQGTAGGTNSGVTTLTDATTNAFNGTLSGFALTGTTSNWINPGQAPTAYLIKASTTNSFTDPVDGTEIATDNDLSDGAAVIKALQGTQIYSSFDGTKGGTTYYFKMWPYTNSGNNINYKTTATVPTASVAFTKPAPLTHVTSLTVNNNNKVINVSWTDAKAANMGNAIALDGANDYITVPDGSIDNGTNTAFTIETWLYWNPVTSSDVHFICGKGLEQMEIHTSGDAGANGLRFIPTSGIYLDAYNVLPVNKWTHVAVVYDATNSFAKMYINGTEVNLTKNGPGVMGAALQNTTSQFDIGRRPYLGSLYYKGKVDEFRVWNKVRTQAEIAANMLNEVSASETGLLVYYKFNQGNEYSANTGLTLVTDASGAANNGTLTNSALSGSTSNWINFKTDAPDGYLIKASKTNNIAAPTNGTVVADDNNLADGNGTVNILAGVQTYSGWTNFTDTTAYYYKIYPYSNSGTARVYNTSAPVPAAKDSVKIDRFYLTSSSIIGLAQGKSKWVDYDNDGDLDLLMIGSNSFNANKSPINCVTKLYNQNVDHTFSEVMGTGFVSVSDGDADWGDYNNDGLLDLIITGVTSYVAINGMVSGSATKLYLQNTNHTFTEQTTINLPNFYKSSVTWGDYDNDGDLDILICGLNSSKHSSIIFRNNGNNSFTAQTQINLEGVYDGDVQWGDYDNDGFLDILMTGSSRFGNTTKIYRNNHNNFFIEQKNIAIPGVISGSISWGDYDNDGDLDILQNGMINHTNPDSTQITRVYTNNFPANSFTRSKNINLPGFYSGCAQWGDVNNDGNLDIVITGLINRLSGSASQIFIQNASHGFEAFTGIGFKSGSNGIISLADYDNDNDLDILFAGYDINENNTYSALYKNNILYNPNFKPNPPAVLYHAAQKDYILLSWNKATDDKTVSKGLTYNIQVGTSKNSCDIINSNSKTSDNSGFRKVVALGNCQQDTFKLVKTYGAGLYYWKVQSIDNSYVGSNFSQVDSIQVDSIQASKLTIRKINNTKVLAKWKRGNGSRCAVFCATDSAGRMAWPVNEHNYMYAPTFSFGENINSTRWFCVYNGINDSIVIDGLDPALTYTIQVVEYITNNTNYTPRYMRKGSPYNDDWGVFAMTDYSPITPLGGGTGPNNVQWYDYNKDGYLDYFYNTHASVRSIGLDTKDVFKALNNGSDAFTRDNSEGSMYNTTICIADFNNDDLLDHIITDQYIDFEILPDNTNFIKSHTYYSTLVRNTTNQGFYRRAISLPVLTNASIDIGDYDNDDFLDIAMCGINLENGLLTTKIFRNNQDSTFSEDNSVLINTQGTIKWGDFNNDEYNDLLLTNSDSLWIYKNLGNDRPINTKRFKVEFSIKKPDALSQIKRSTWLDQDNDGDLDIIITGSNTNDKDTSILLTNLYPLQLFTQDNITHFVQSPDIKTADYDNDGDIDYISGSKLYRNNAIYAGGFYMPNRKPGIPNDLKVIRNNGKIKLEWSAITSDETDSSDMTYDVRIRRKGESHWFNAPITNSSGSRRTVSLGRYKTCNANINLPIDEYEWQVQAIDQGYESSNWSAINSFRIGSYFTVDTVCFGDTTIFIDNSFSSEGIINWRWDFGDIPTVTGKEQKHVFQTTGDHPVRLIITNSKMQNDTVYGNAYVKPIPSVSFTADDVCEGLTATIINPANTNGLIDWIWDFGDGSTSNYFNPGTHTYAEKKNYTIKFKVTGENNCSNTATKTIAIKDRPAKPEISESINDFCPGTEVKLEVTSSTDGLNFQWKRNGGNIDGATGKSYTGKLTAADYSVVVEPGSCSSESDKLPITTKPAPPKPNILGHGPTIWTLACDNMTATSYKWFYNNTDIPIPGANGYQYYANREYGDYYVSVNEGGECWTQSDVFKAELASGIDDLSYDNVKIYPNPSAGVFKVSLDNKISGELNVRVVNVLGSVVLSQINRTSDFDVDISSLTNGIYYISISYKDEVIIKKVVKQ